MNTPNLPAYLQNRRPSGVTAGILAGLPSGSPPTLSIRSQRFTLVDAAGNERPAGAMDPQLGLYVDVVIVHVNPHTSKLFYDVAYDPSAQDFSPPACFSDNGLGPSRQSAKPQSPTCAACPKNQWGSDVSKITGKATKACNDAKKIAVVMPDNPDMAFLLRVPPNSLKHISAYAKMVGAQSLGDRPVEVSDVVTRITFDKQVQGTLNFAPVGWIDERTAVALDKIWVEKKADEMIGLNDTPHGGPYALSGASAAPQQAPAAQQLPPPAPPPQAQAIPFMQQPPNPNASFPAQPAFVPASPAQSATPPSAPEAPVSPKPKRGRGRPAGTTQAVETAKEAWGAAMVPQQAPFMAPQQNAAPQHTPEIPQNFSRPESPSGDLELPAFLRRDAPPPAAPPSPAQQAGIATPMTPHPEMQDAIKRAFDLPIPGSGT